MLLCRSVSPRRRWVAAVLATGALLVSAPATQARVFVGLGFGFGFPAFGPPYPFSPYYAPGVVVAPPPPVVHAPPPVAYGPYGPPVTYAAPGYGVAPRCFAGAYVCPLDRPGVVGGPYSCPSNTGRGFHRLTRVRYPGYACWDLRARLWARYNRGRGRRRKRYLQRRMVVERGHNPVE